MISVILNVYKRPYSLEKQIESILNQSVKVNPENIHVWYNTPEDGTEHLLPKNKKIKTYKCNYNTKFFGRFTLPLLCKTPYVAMFDDDIICGKDWFKNCLETIEVEDAILGGSGVLLQGKQYQPNSKVGWNGNRNGSPIEVDLVGHAWFFEKEWLKYLWMEKPFTWNNGEDIQFSYTAQKYGNIKTYCPPHPSSNKELHSSLQGYELGVDSKATSNSRNHEVFYAQRDACVKNAIINGWKPVYKRNK